MRRTWILAMASLASLASGCTPVTSDSDLAASGPHSLAKGIYTMADCPGFEGGHHPPIEGVVNIVLPKKLESRIPRSVNTRKINRFDPADPDPGSSTANTNPPPPGDPGQPFDVYFREMASEFPGTRSGYVMVRIIILENSEWEFFETGLLHGVGLADPADGGVLCGSYPVLRDTTPSVSLAEPKQIALFYVDLSRFDWTDPNYKARFNIALFLPGSEETPIIIDPKIRNERSVSF